MIRVRPGGCSLRASYWGGRTRTSNFPVNSRAVCQLTYTPKERRGQANKHDRLVLSMNIDAAKTSDLPELLALLKASSLPVAGIEQHLDNALVARDKGTLIGCAAVEIYGSAGLLRSVAVAARRPGEGVGQRLTKAAPELDRKRGVRNIHLLTPTASPFFPRFGFLAIPRAELDPA